MSPLLRLALAVGVAFAAAAAGGALVRACGPIDRPRGRSSHEDPTVTAGGIGVIAGAAAGLLVLGPGFGGAAPSLTASLWAFALAAALGGVGALDDLLDLPAGAKLLLQGAAALAFAVFGARVETIATPFGPLGLGPVAGALGAALWLVVVVNAVNFMDGVNGLAAGGCAVMLAVSALGARTAGCEPVAALTLIVAGATLGFLPWNFPRARLFQGDAGALFTSFILASALLIAPGPDAGGRAPLLFGPTLLTPFLVDVFLTLLRRARRGARLFDAHAEHLYQRWFAAHGRSHVAVSLRALGIVIVYAALAAGLLLVRQPDVQWAVFLSGVVVAAAAWSRISSRLDRRA